VDQARSGFPTRSRFTHNKDGHICLRQQFSLGAKFLHDRAGADEECLFAEYFHVITGAVAYSDIMSGGKTSSNRAPELLLIKWPKQKILRAKPYRFFFPSRILCEGEQNNRQFGTQPAQPTQNMQGIGIAARQIEQQQVRHSACLDSLQRFPPAAGGFEMPRIGLAN
jgi:hypothetical protein